MKRVLRKDLPELYKVVTCYGTSPYAKDFEYSLPEDGKPGDWHTVEGELVPCSNGLHCATWAQLFENWFEDSTFVIYKVETSGPVYNCDDKYICRKLRLLHEVPHPAWVHMADKIWSQLTSDADQRTYPSQCPANVKHWSRGDEPSDQLEEYFGEIIGRPICKMQLELMDYHIWLHTMWDFKHLKPGAQKLMILRLHSCVTNTTPDSQLANYLETIVQMEDDFAKYKEVRDAYGAWYELEGLAHDGSLMITADGCNKYFPKEKTI
jgi:hypothetical protein